MYFRPLFCHVQPGNYVHVECTPHISFGLPMRLTYSTKGSYQDQLYCKQGNPSKLFVTKYSSLVGKDMNKQSNNQNLSASVSNSL